MEEQLGVLGQNSSATQNTSIDKSSQNQKSIIDTFNTLMDQGAPKIGQGNNTFSYVPTAGLDLSGRYDKIYSKLDNEELYATYQGTAEKFGNGVAKFAGIAASTFVNGTAGLVYGVFDWARTGEFKSVFDNELTRELNDFNNEYLETTFANYKTQREINADWWEPENLLTANFWADNIIKNLGFSAGAAAGGFAWSGLLKAVGLTSKLVAQGKNMAAAADAAVASANALPQAQRLSTINTALSNLYNGAKVGTGRALAGLDRGIVATFGSAGEAGIEALNSSQEFRKSLIDKYIADRGYAPTGEDLIDINETASNVGKTVYGLNIGLLSWSNYVQLPKIFSSTFKGEKTIVNDIVFEGGKYASALPKKGIAKSFYKARNIAGLAFNIPEALEEASQFAAQVGTQNYFTKLEESGDASVLDDLFFEGAKEAFTTSEGLLNFFIGGVSGAIMTSGIPTLGMTGSIAERGFTGYGGRKEKLRNETVELFNKSLIKDKLKDSAQMINLSEKIQQDRAQKISEGNVSVAKDLEFDFLFGTMLNRAKYTSIEFVNEEIKDLKNLASTEEGFLQLQQQGYAYKTDTRQSFTNRLDNISKQAEYINKTYQDINLKYKGVVNEEGEIVYSPAVIDKLTYAASKIFDYDARIPSLNNKLTSNGVNTAELFSDVILNGKPTVEAIEKALADVKANGAINEDELTQDLFELIEMGMKRKKFIDEYKEIKENPSKFTPVKKDPDTVIPKEDSEKGVVNRIKIKTKAGERNYETGVEYFLGSVVEYDANGNEVYRFPKLTILGQNPDGTIRIKDNKGERDINPEVLEKYKLGKVSTIANNPEASFYMENVNTVVEWNMGKDKGGVKKGRLEFDSEKNQLMFTYATKDKKGKRFIKSIPIDLKSFEPKPGFKTAIFSLGRELTATEKEQIKKSKEKKVVETAPKLYDLNAQEDRAKFINDYHNEVIEKQAELEKTIKQKRADILTIEEELEKVNKIIEKGGDDSRAKRGTRLKSSVRKALDAAMRLSRAKEDLLQEVIDLEAQREDGELLLSYLEDAVQNISELSGDSKSIIDELEFETELLKESIEENGKQINTITRLIDNIDSTLDSTISFLRSLINEFEKNYPKAPTVMGVEFNEFLKANPNFLKLKPNFISDLRELERLIAEVEDMEISPNEEKLNNLLTEIKSLKETFKSDLNDLMFKEALLTKMKKAYQEYQASGIEEAKLAKNENLRKQILGTADNDNPVPTVFDKEYEVDAKKPLSIVPRATMGVDRGKPHQKRAQRFGMNFKSFDNDQKKDIKGVYITLKNQDQLIPGLMDHLRTDENGIDETVNVNTIIAMVMVDMSTGQPVLINQDGLPLTEEQLQDPLNNSIYQVFPLEKLQWSGEYDNQSMFADNVSENVRSEIRKQYAEWRSRILEIENLSEVHSIDVSFGTPEVNKDAEGKKLYDTRTSVQDAGLIDDYEIDTTPVITVATSDESILRGISVTKSSPGKVFLEMGNGLVPLNNRKHSKKEAETIFNAILQFSKNVLDKNKGVNDEQSKNLLRFLKSVVYWGIPANEAGFSSVFFKDGKLYMSGKGAAFPFTPSGLLQNKEDIIATLEGMYLNVNGKYAREVNLKYEQITKISEDGTIESVVWENYQSYLLSTTTPDGKKRSGEQIPLSTYMRPLQGPTDVNRSGIYFYTTDTEDAYIIPEVKKEIKITPVSPAEQQSVQVFELDNKTPNEFIIKKLGGKIIRFLAPENATKETITILDSPDLKDVIAYVESQGKDPIGSIKAVILKEIAAGKSVTPTASTGVQRAVNNIFGAPQATAQPSVQPTTPTNIPDTTDTPTGVKKAISNIFGAPQPITPTPQSSSAEEEAKRRSEELKNKTAPTQRKNRADYREVVEKQAKSMQIEDWNEIEAAWKTMLPGVPLYRLKNLINATNGAQAFGMLKNGAIYVYENAEVGTFYHEVFEAVWKMFADPSEQKLIIDEFKSRTGSFIDRPTGNTIKYSEATPQQIKEQLAEEFRDYVLFKKAPIKPKDGRPFIVRLFSDIVNVIKKLFTGKDANINTEKLFKRIKTGYYAKSVPSMGVLEKVPTQIIEIDNEFATEEDELRILIPYKQQHELIQHMVYKTLSVLGNTDQSLFNVNKIKKVDLNNDLFAEILGTVDDDNNILENGIIGEMMNLNNDNYTAGKISANEFLALDNTLKETYSKVNEQWNELFEKYEEYMAQYQIEFNEDEELEINDQDKTREISPDATKIDAFRKSSPAIKLLLATLPKTTGVKDLDGKEPATITSVGGNELLPLGQTFITLMNKLHTSRDVSEMMENLRELALEDGNYFRLYERIAKKKPNDGKFEFKKLTTLHSLQLLSSFYSVFKKQNPGVKNVFILENGDVVIGDANLSKASAQIANDYENGIIFSAREGKGYLEYSVADKAYVVKDSVNNLKFNSSNVADNDNAMLKFLNDIGIEFDKNDFRKLDNDDKIKFRDIVKGIRDSFVKNKVLMLLSKKTLSVQGRLTQLAFLKLKSSNPEMESTYFNISNEQTQSHIGVNPLSDLKDFISSVKNINDNSVKESHYKYLVKDAFAKGSVIMKKLFHKTGKKIKEDNADYDLLSVEYVGGTKDDSKGKQKPSSKLTYPERLSQEINLNLNGYYLNLVPGDASIEWMVKMGNHVSALNISNGYKEVMEIFKEYFIAEYELAKSPDRVIDPSRESDRNNLRFFYDILGEELNNEIVTLQDIDAEAAYLKFQSRIESAVKKYINKKTQTFRNTLGKYGILKYDGIGYSLTNIDINQNSMYSLSESMNENTLNNNLSALTVNYMIANIELHKLMYSDPYQYKDELKRIKSFSSPRQAIMSDPDSLNIGFNINAAMQNVLNAGFEKDDIGYTDFNRNHFNTVTHADVIGIIDVPGQDYEVYKETDGSGIISLKAHRNLKFRAGQWTDSNELQYRHDVAYEKLVRSGADENTIRGFEINNPGDKSTYTPVKPIVAGTTDNDQGYNEIVLDKFALYPLSFRVMHQVNKTSNAMKLYDKMQKEDIDYIVFNSGRKVGARNPHTTYNVDGSFNNAPYVKDGKDQNIIKVPFKIISIQVEVPSKDKALVTRGSQMTKLLTMDFMAAGVPVDFMPSETNFNKRYQEWNLLDEAGKETSKLYREIKNNRELLQAMTEFGYQSLLKKLGIVETKTGYEISDFSIAANTLRKEVLKREVNDNVTKSLESFLDGKAILEATPAYQQVRNILFSIVDSNVVSPKISGGMKVQIPSTLLESNKVGIQEINGKKGFVSDTLKFYEKDGERVAEVMIGRWFDSPLSDEELVDYFNNDPEGKKQLSALFGVAFRIPTQNQNSIDAIKIAKFLPKEFGDSVVIPSALVAKVGSDFDIDKLSMYLKNLYLDENYNLKLVPFYGYGQQAIDKFKSLSREITEQKIAIREEKINKQSTLQRIFGDIAIGNTSSKIAEKWIPIFRQWFANDLINNQLPVQLIESVFIDRIESLNKKIEELTIKDLDELFIEEHADRLYKASLENAYIESSENLIKSDENYDKLMTPNSADQMKALSIEIAKKTVGGSYDYRNVGNMLDRNFMSSLRHAFVTGKYAIGIAAVNQTNHSLMQRFASFVDPARLSNVSKIDQRWLGDAKVKFPKFNQFDGKATMSMIKNAGGQFISDIIGQFIDGYVDISNGPWIMELGATPNVASTWLFLVKIGVPIEDVAYFMNQPIIREYLGTIENSGYSWLFIDNFVDDAMDKFNPNSQKAARTQIPNTKSLKDMVGKEASELSPDEKADQQFILGEFLKYAKMAEHMFLVTQGTNYDTANFNDSNLLFKKNEQFKKAQKTIISSVDEILNNSFVGTTAQTLSKTVDATAEILTSDKNKIRKIIHRVLKPYVEINDREFVKIAQRVVSDLFDYAVQTNTIFKNKVLQTMVSNGGYANDIIKMVKEIKSNPNHPLFDNHVINIIVPQLASDASPKSANNIKIKGSSNKIYDQNSIIYSFRELKEYLESTEQGFKYQKFKMLALYQSGLSSNRLSFTSLLPFEDFENIYNDTIEKLESLPNIETFANLNVFERNNWGNDEIVPNEKARWINLQDGTPVYNPAMKYLPKNVQDAIDRGEIPQILSRSTLGRNSDRDFFVYSWEDAGITKDKKAEMRKRGDFSYIKRGLFKRVKSGGEPFINTSKNKDYFIYQAVNAWGARERAQEFYDVEKPSMLDNGFIKVDNVAADERIVNLFMSKKSITARTEAPQPSTNIKPKRTINVYWGQAESATSTRILSNLAPRKFKYESTDGVLREYGSVEHAYQSNKNGKFDKATYDAYVNLKEVANKQGSGYGAKISPKLTDVGKRGNLQLMKDLVVESFIQNPNSDAAKKLLQYENFTHNTNELIDKAFLEGLKLAQFELMTSKNKPGDLPSTNRSPKSC
jgi:hypothetical protein